MAIWTDIPDFVAYTALPAAKVNQIRDNGEFLKENVELGAAGELTIASGGISITKSYHTVDTEGDAPTDDLESIGGGNEGRILVLRAASNDRIVVLKDGIGNLRLGGADVYLDNIGTHVMLICNSSGNYCLLGFSSGPY